MCLEDTQTMCLEDIPDEGLWGSLIAVAGASQHGWVTRRRGGLMGPHRDHDFIDSPEVLKKPPSTGYFLNYKDGGIPKGGRGLYMACGEWLLYQLLSRF